MQEKILSRRTDFDGKLLRLDVLEVELQNGKRARREIVHHPDAVCCAVLTTEKEWVFVRQFRVPTGAAMLEVPAGKIDGQEAPRSAVIRELEEEVGYLSGELVELSQFWTTPGFCSERLTCFLAHNAQLGTARPDVDEFLEIHKVPCEEGLRMIFDGRLIDAKSITALLLSARHLGL